MDGLLVELVTEAGEVTEAGDVAEAGEFADYVLADLDPAGNGL